MLFTDSKDNEERVVSEAGGYLKTQLVVIAVLVVAYGAPALSSLGEGLSKLLRDVIYANQTPKAVLNALGMGSFSLSELNEKFTSDNCEIK